MIINQNDLYGVEIQLKDDNNPDGGPSQRISAAKWISHPVMWNSLKHFVYPVVQI